MQPRTINLRHRQGSGCDNIEVLVSVAETSIQGQPGSGSKPLDLELHNAWTLAVLQHPRAAHFRIVLV